jgi:transcription antitermination factor NusG
MPDYSVMQWYALYTCANHEKRVSEQLGCRQIENFLPVYESRRKWRDRQVTLQRPLFQSYIFVHMALQDRHNVLRVPGVAQIVAFGGRPAPIAEEELRRIREILRRGTRIEPHPYLQVGRRVRVRSGALTGLEGIIVRRKKLARLVVAIELIQRAVAVEISEGLLEPLPLKFEALAT